MCFSRPRPRLSMRPRIITLAVDTSVRRRRGARITKMRTIEALLEEPDAIELLAEEDTFFQGDT
jgi:hypothetical protein